MDIKKILIPIIGIGTTVTSAFLLKGKSKPMSNVVRVTTEVIEKPEKTFGGISLSELNKVAKSIYHGLKVTIDEYGFLVFHYTSKSGKTTHHQQITINEFGKLVNLGGYYPNQWWSTADQFVKKANELFLFKK